MEVEPLPAAVPKTRQEIHGHDRWRLDYALRRLASFESAATEARVYFASLALEMGIAGVARELEVSHEAVRQRVASVRERAEKMLTERQHLRSIRSRQTKLTKEAREALLESQGRRCALCGAEGRQYYPLHLDHDHATGRNRAFLCASCNKRVGSLEADLTYIPKTYVGRLGNPPPGGPIIRTAQEWREAALAYLAQHGSLAE